MPQNHFFNNFNSRPEQTLYDDLVNECIGQHGITSYYLPRSSESTFDLIFGDDPTKKFDEAYPLCIYVKNVDNFEGQELFSKFGLEITHQMRFIVTTREFNRFVPPEYSRPREGDLVWLSNFQALFEIKFVNQQHFFYAFGNTKFYGFELVCERFRYSNEDVTTGIIDIDESLDSKVISYDYFLTADANNHSTYLEEEIVYQGVDLSSATASAEVVAWDKPSMKLQLREIKGTFTTNNTIHGVQSGAAFVLDHYDILNNANDGLDNNSELKDLGSTGGIIDFSESNPFGNP